VCSDGAIAEGTLRLAFSLVCATAFYLQPPLSQFAPEGTIFDTIAHKWTDKSKSVMPACCATSGC